MDTISLVVSDSGIGFDPDRRTQGLGLVSIKERVRIGGGSLSVASRPGEGTKIEVRIPLKKGVL